MARQQDIVLLNYLDDLCSVASPEKSVENYEKLGNLLATLGLLESEEKAIFPSTRVEFLGVLFDSCSQTMEVTRDRLVEISELIGSWLEKKKASKRQLQSLIGKLVFVTRCVFASRIFISRMLSTLRSLKFQSSIFYVSKEFRKDLFWWKRFLKEFNGVTYIPDMDWKQPDLIISTDACLVGAGGWCGAEFFSTKFPLEIIKKGFHINILEMLTMLVALKLWAKECSGMRLQFYCDNDMSVRLINSGKSRDVHMLGIIREIVYICSTKNIHIWAVHLPGVTNRKADFLSRADNQADFASIMGPDSSRLEVSDELFEFREIW